MAVTEYTMERREWKGEIQTSIQYMNYVSHSKELGFYSTNDQKAMTSFIFKITFAFKWEMNCRGRPISLSWPSLVGPGQCMLEIYAN